MQNRSQSNSNFMPKGVQGSELVKDQDEASLKPRPEHKEGTVARSIEHQTAKIPSDWFLWAAVGSIGTSLSLRVAGKDKLSNFIGQWAPTILILGLYNKIVKVSGSH